MNTEIIIRLLLAAGWGGIVGLEREFRSKSAGFRTMIMISTGSCFFTIMSSLIGGTGNPDRIAANIVTGIGFLGAGVIFREADNKVTGITTAATIWTVAAIGMGIGAGYYFAAAVASLLILVVLAILPLMERGVDQLSQARTYLIQRTYRENAGAPFEQLMRDCKLQFKPANYIKQRDLVTLTWEVRGSARNHQAFCERVAADEDVQRFEY